MNKKFLTAFLFGATLLASTSTFVSCKDYDDDIKDVQEQVNKEVTARKALETKVAAAEKAIEDIKAHEAECDAAQAAALKDAKEALQAAIDAQATKEANDVVALNAAIDKALIDAKAYTDAAKALCDAKDAELEAGLSKIQNDLSDVITNLGALTDEIAAARGQYATLKAALDAQDAALKEYADKGDATLKAAYEKADTEIRGELAAAVSTLEKAIADGDAATIKAANEALAAEVAKLEKAIADGDAATIAAAKEEITALATALKAADKVLDDKIQACADECKGNFDEINGTILGIKNAMKGYATKDEVKTAIDGVYEAINDIKDNVIPGINTTINALDVKINVIQAILSNQLRSLVFMPELYVDGIEAIRYRVLCDTALIKTSPYAIERQRTWGNKETIKKKISNLTDYVLPASPKTLYVGGTWPVEYHMNPSTANVEFKDIKKFYDRDVTVITRAKECTELGITSPEFYEDGKTPVFGTKAGILTAGIKLAKPETLFKNGPAPVINYNEENRYDAMGGTTGIDPNMGTYESATGHYSNGKDDVVALQVYSDVEKKDTVITSDYALLWGTKVFLEGIVWNDNVGKTNKDGKLDNKFVNAPYTSDADNCDEAYADPNGYGKAGRDMYRCKQQIHVWDTPDEALLNDQELVQLAYNGKAGDIVLENYLALHWYEENVNRTGWEAIQKTNFTDKALDKSNHNIWTTYGLSYEFEFVNYVIDTNNTSDSRYAYFADANDGKWAADDQVSPRGDLVAGTAEKVSGVRLQEQTKASVDREPLVRVKVKHGNDVLLDGYILVHISETIVPPAPKTIPFEGEVKFDLCNDAAALAINWATFSKVILADSLKIEKLTFDTWFGAAADDVTETSMMLPYCDILQGAADGDWAKAEYVDPINKLAGIKFNCDLYAKPGAEKNKGTYGRVEYHVNENGTTNHTFTWYLTAEEMEAISHDKENGGEATVYIRWTGKSASPINYLYAKLTVKVTREDVVKYSITEKNNNYWYDANPDGKSAADVDAGLTAVLINVDNPRDGQNTKIWKRPLLNDWIANEVFLEKDGKLVETMCHAKPANVTTLDEDIVATTADKQATKAHVAQGAKFYFTPETTTMKVSSIHGDKTYTITPQKSAADKEWNMLVPRYITHRMAASTSYFTGHDESLATNDKPSCELDKTMHEWKSEENANSIINKCAIDYNAGVYANKALYAVYNNVYTKIATLDQQTGVVELIHYTEGSAEFNVVCDVLNLVGYDKVSASHHENIDDELRAKVGIIATTKCDLASQMEDATWLASWERPINLDEIADTAVIDANTNANKIYIADLLHFFDYRGPVSGDMNKPANKWLWAYYNIHYITVNCDPKLVQTNMHIGSNNGWTALEKIDPKYVTLKANEDMSKTKKYEFDLTPWNKQVKSAELYDKIHKGELREQLGYIYYDNNGYNVTDFDVIVPITVGYEWGCFTQNVKIHVHRTMGN